jgi:UDP-glucose 4-epimerase
MRIGITGARGRLAPLLVKHFRSLGAGVDQYSRTPGPGVLPLQELFNNPPKDVIVHCAWSTVPITAEADPDAVFREDLPLLKQLVESTTDRQTRIIFPSSGAVYGNTGQSHASELDSTNPLGSYAKAKIVAENFLLENAPSRSFILRATNLLGESADPNKPQGILPRLIDSVVHGTVVQIWGDGSATKDYIHCSDFLAGLDSALNSGSPGIWNVGSGASYSLMEIIHIVESLSGKTVRLTHRPPFAWDVSYSKISVDKLIGSGWHPKTTIHAAIADLLRDWPQA